MMWNTNNNPLKRPKLNSENFEFSRISLFFPLDFFSTFCTKFFSTCPLLNAIKLPQLKKASNFAGLTLISLWLKQLKRHKKGMKNNADELDHGHDPETSLEKMWLYIGTNIDVHCNM